MANFVSSATQNVTRFSSILPIFDARDETTIPLTVKLRCISSRRQHVCVTSGVAVGGQDGKSPADPRVQRPRVPRKENQDNFPVTVKTRTSGYQTLVAEN